MKEKMKLTITTGVMADDKVHWTSPYKTTIEVDTDKYKGCSIDDYIEEAICTETSIVAGKLKEVDPDGTRWYSCNIVWREGCQDSPILVHKVEIDCPTYAMIREINDSNLPEETKKELIKKLEI